MIYLFKWGNRMAGPLNNCVAHIIVISVMALNIITARPTFIASKKVCTAIDIRIPASQYAVVSLVSVVVPVLI